MRFLIIILITLTFQLNSNAQFSFIPTNYLNNISNVNPAYAGSRDGFSISKMLKNNWIGFKGAPFIYEHNINSPIYKDYFGAGFTFSIERAGSKTNYSFYGDFSTTIKLNETKKHDLRIGVKAGTELIQSHRKTIGVPSDIDPSFYNDVNEAFLPNFGFGFIYEQTNFYFGYSIPKIIQNIYTANYISNKPQFIARQNRSHIFMLGALIAFDKSKIVQFKPSLFSLVNESLSVQQRILLNFEFLETFWFGSSLELIQNPNFSNIRLNEFGTNAGLRILKILELAYTFNYNISPRPMLYNGGSHEFTLRIDFIYNKDKNLDKSRWF